MIVSPLVIFSIVFIFILCSIFAWRAAGNYSLLFSPRGKGPSQNSGFSVSDSLKHLDEAMVVVKQIINRSSINEER